MHVLSSTKEIGSGLFSEDSFFMATMRFSDVISLLPGFNISPTVHFSRSIACADIFVIGLPQYWRRQERTSSKYSGRSS